MDAMRCSATRWNGDLHFLTAAAVTVILLSAISSTFAEKYVPADRIFLNCGAESNEKDADGKEWVSDERSKFLSSSKSTTAQASSQNPSVPQIPYITARLFNTTFSYTFPLSSGRKFLRLYFYPSSYGPHNASTTFFSVSAGSYTLLSNFSVGQTASAINHAFIVKEYSIFVSTQSLNLTFVPENNPPLAFVNGIEIVSMPDIYSNSLLVAGRNAPFRIGNSSALENLYRVNAGGGSISPSGDSGMFRSWQSDDIYLRGAARGAAEYASSPTSIKYSSIFDSYIAPPQVYQSIRSMGPSPGINLNYNLTWSFSVDSGFMYLIRLHFCVITNTFYRPNQLVFDIFLFNQTAESGFDLVHAAGNSFVPIHRDYVVFVPGQISQTELAVSLHPNTKSKPEYYDAALNGIEVFKINNTNASLAGLNPILLYYGDFSPEPSMSGKLNSKQSIISGLMALFLLVLAIWTRVS